MKTTFVKAYGQEVITIDRDEADHYIASIADLQKASAVLANSTQKST